MKVQNDLQQALNDGVELFWYSWNSQWLFHTLDHNYEHPVGPSGEERRTVWDCAEMDYRAPESLYGSSVHCGIHARRRSNIRELYIDKAAFVY